MPPAPEPTVSVPVRVEREAAARGEGVFLREEGSGIVLGRGSLSLRFSRADFLRAGGNPFDCLRAAGDAAPGDDCIQVQASARREAQAALRWTNGPLSQWWLLSRRAHEVRGNDEWIEVSGEDADVESALEVLHFATPVARRPVIDFDLRAGATSALVRRVPAFTGETPWRIDATLRRVVASVPQDEVSAYESWVLMSMLDPGVDYVARWREVAVEVAAWMEGERPAWSDAARAAPAPVVVGVLWANEELWADGLDTGMLADAPEGWHKAVAEAAAARTEERARRQRERHAMRDSLRREQG